MSCQDLMLWIGTSYYKIDCGREEVTREACAHGPRGMVKRCYVHEAAYRGCCRRLPDLIPWAVPGETRVFLVHPASCEEGHQGTLFGYYMLERFEALVDSDTYDRLEDPDSIPWSEDLLEEVHEEARRVHTSSKPFQRDELRRIKEATNEQFERHRQEFARQVIQKQVVYRKPGRASQEDMLQELLKEILEDILEQLLERLIEERVQKWNRKVISGPGGELRVLNCRHTAGEGMRACSPPNTEGRPPLSHKRTKPGAVYAVDLLTAQITDRYVHLLKEELEDPAGIEKRDIAKKEELFRKAASQVGSRRAEGEYATGGGMERLPRNLRKAAVKRGELVLFPRPFPVIQRCPHASFRGYLRLDGDQLVEEVERALGERRRLVKVPYCLGLERGGPMTKAQLQAYMARELLINQSMAERFLEILTEMAVADIAQHGRFVLPGFGSLSLESDGEIGFYAYKALRDKFE
jgi:hypothetical protein